MHAGDVPVKHDHFVVGDRGMLKRVVAVEDDVDGHPRLPQAGRQRHRQPGVILHEQYPHDLIMPGWVLQKGYCVALPQRRPQYTCF